MKILREIFDTKSSRVEKCLGSGGRDPVVGSGQGGRGAVTCNDSSKLNHLLIKWSHIDGIRAITSLHNIQFWNGFF